MSNQSFKSQIIIANKRLEEFNTKTDKCPICRNLFKTCKHSYSEATERFKENIFRLIIKDEIYKANKSIENAWQFENILK